MEQRIRRDLRYLEGMTDSQLRDIGIRREDIPFAVRHGRVRAVPASRQTDRYSGQGETFPTTAATQPGRQMSRHSAPIRKKNLAGAFNSFAETWSPRIAGQDLPASEYFRMVASDLQERGIPSLATAEGQAFVDLDVREADLIVVDNIATLAGTGGENESDAWRPVQDWALRQRAAGRSVLFIHHANKNGGQRGTSAREDVLDSVLSLTRPPGYDASMGARFECHFTKSRGFYGPDAEPFEAKFDGERWTTGSIQAGDDISDLTALQKAGMSVRQIADRAGISKSAVSRKLKGASDDDE